MCRRPLLPLLALAVLMVNLPSSHALSCYQCEDPPPTASDHPLLKSSGRTVPRCTDFDPSDDKFKIEQCQPHLDKRCAKIAWGGGEMRSCYDTTIDVGCVEEDGVSFCACTEDYCNSAGLTTPALLLLLPAALMAALYTA